MPPSLTIPDAELIERFVRASGPGGQNVNKVATAVALRSMSPTRRPAMVVAFCPADQNARCAVSRRSDTPPRARPH